MNLPRRPGMHKTGLALLFLLFTVLFGLRLHHDLVRVDDAFFIDLRNRITGTRLLKMDTTPYFFKWNMSYPITLYDPFDRCHIKNNMTTAPPSLLLLMEPLAPLSFTDFCKWWIVLHYLAFLIMTLAILYCFRGPPAPYLVLIAASLLLLSDPWRDTVYKGQSHFIFAALVACIFLVASRRNQYRFLYAGLITALLLWLRPNALLLVPFVLVCRNMNRKQFIMGLGSGLLSLGMLTLALGHQQYWFEFYETCRLWLQHSANETPMPMCHFTHTVEGKTFKRGPTTLYWQSETTDLFRLIRNQLHINIKAVHLSLIFILTYVSTLVISYKRTVLSFTGALLTGILLYWFSEMTSPILRTTYYYVEMFAVVLFLAANTGRMPVAGKLLLLASFTLLFFSSFPMNLMFSEWCIIGCAIIMLSRKHSL
ncbi:MAG TPA: glycosyltransferase family 87 protein [Chitinophagaceae bacterium]|nr:glycosyltransferase family 87 protein [Chitinophagaceae bacterium]